MEKWHRAGRMLLAEASNLPRHRYAALAAVAKSVDEDRQIIDRRGADGEEDEVEGPSIYLPSAVDLCEIPLGPGEKLVSNGSDLAHCYHHIAVSQERAFTNPIGKPLSAAEVQRRGWGRCKWDPEAPPADPGPAARTSVRARSVPLRRSSAPPPIRPGVPTAACFDGLPMGDHVAVERAWRAASPRRVAGPKGGPRRKASSAGPRIPSEVYRRSESSVSGPSFARSRCARQSRAAARQGSVGCRPARGKLVRDAEEDTVLGGELLGVQAHLGPPPRPKARLDGPPDPGSNVSVDVGALLGVVVGKCDFLSPFPPAAPGNLAGNLSGRCVAAGAARATAALGC